MAYRAIICILLLLAGLIQCIRIEQVILGNTFELECGGNLRRGKCIHYIKNKSEVFLQDNKASSKITIFSPKFKGRVRGLWFGAVAIDNANFQDSGDYTCRFHVKKQTTSETVLAAGTIEVVEKKDVSPAPPKPLIQRENVRKGNTTERILRCFINDNKTRGPLRYSWFSNSHGQITNNTRKGQIEVSDTLASVRYWCLVSNLAGPSPPSDHVIVGHAADNPSYTGPLVGGLVPGLVIANGLLLYCVCRKESLLRRWRKRNRRVRRIDEPECVMTGTEFIPVQQMEERNAVDPEFANYEVPVSRSQVEDQMSSVEFPPKKQQLRRLYPVKNVHGSSTSGSHVKVKNESAQSIRHDGKRVKPFDPAQPGEYLNPDGIQHSLNKVSVSDARAQPLVKGNPYISQPVNNQRMPGKRSRTPREPSDSSDIETVTETYEEMQQQSKNTPSNIHTVEPSVGMPEETYEDVTQGLHVCEQNLSTRARPPLGGKGLLVGTGGKDVHDSLRMPNTGQNESEEYDVYDDAGSSIIYDNLVVPNRPERGRHGDVKTQTAPPRPPRGTLPNFSRI